MFVLYFNGDTLLIEISVPSPDDGTEPVTEMLKSWLDNQNMPGFQKIMDDAYEIQGQGTGFRRDCPRTEISDRDLKNRVEE
jgi:hypothetical protein